MNRRQIVLLGSAALALMARGVAAERPSPSSGVVIEHVTIIDPVSGSRATDQTLVVHGARIVAVGPGLDFYTSSGRRRIGPPLRFGLGVLRHLSRAGGRYDVVHTASFPYFSLLAAGLARRTHGFRLFVDWFELWTRAYWREYLDKLTLLQQRHALPEGRAAALVERGVGAVIEEAHGAQCGWHW